MTDSRQQEWMERYAPREGAWPKLTQPVNLVGRVMNYYDSPFAALWYTKGVAERYPEAVQQHGAADLYKAYVNDPTMGVVRLAEDFPAFDAIRGGLTQKAANIAVAYAKTVGINPLTYLGGALAEAQGSRNALVRTAANVVGVPLDPVGTGLRATRALVRATPIGQAYRIAGDVQRQAIDKGLIEQALWNEYAKRIADEVTHWADDVARAAHPGTSPTGALGMRNWRAIETFRTRQRALADLSSIWDTGWDVAENFLMSTGTTRPDAAQIRALVPRIEAAMQGRIDDLVNVAGYDRRGLENAFNAIRNQEREMGNRRWQLGIADQDSVEFWSPMHLRRIYEKWMDQPGWFREIVNVDPDEAMRAMGQYRSGGGTGPVPRGARTMRRFLSGAARETFGESNNAVLRFLEGMRVNARAVGGARAAQEIAARPEWASHGAGLIPGIDYTPQVPNNAMFGALRGDNVAFPAMERLLSNFDRKNALGLYADLPTFGRGSHAMGHINAIADNWTAAFQNSPFLRSMVGMWKFGKVVAVPGAWSRNLQSNMWRAYTEAGMRPDEFLEGLVAGFQDIRTNSPLWQEARESNITFHETLLGADTRYDFARRMGDREGFKGFAGDQLAKVNQMVERGSNAYGGVELASKMSVYRHARLKLGLSAEEAGALAERTLFTHSNVPGLVKFGSASGIVPFGNYRWNAIVGEGRSWANFPGRFQTLRRLGQIVESGAAQDLDERYRYKMSNIRPLRGGLHVLMPEWVTKATGQYDPEYPPYTTWDASYVAPAMPNTPMGPGAVLGEADWLAQQAWSTMGPIFTVPAQIGLNSRAGSTRSLANALDPKERYGEYARFIGESLLPPWTPGVGYIAQNVMRAKRGGKTPEQQPYSIRPTLFSSALGFRINATPNIAVLRDISRTQNEIRGLQQEYEYGLDIRGPAKRGDLTWDQYIDRLLKNREAALQMYMENIGRLDTLDVPERYRELQPTP